MKNPWIACWCLLSLGSAHSHNYNWRQCCKTRYGDVRRLVKATALRGGSSQAAGIAGDRSAEAASRRKKGPCERVKGAGLPQASGAPGRS